MTFQERVALWMQECFGPKISSDRRERNHRFLEEALELVQANGCSVEDARTLVEYVYSRDIGRVEQEIGGVMVTLAALCLASSQDMHDAGEKELARIWTKVEAIRAKQATKPTGSALPQKWNIRADIDNPNGPQFKQMREALIALAFHPAHKHTAMGRRARAVLTRTDDETDGWLK